MAVILSIDKNTSAFTDASIDKHAHKHTQNTHAHTYTQAHTMHIADFTIVPMYMRAIGDKDVQCKKCIHIFIL